MKDEAHHETIWAWVTTWKRTRYKGPRRCVGEEPSCQLTRAGRVLAAGRRLARCLAWERTFLHLCRHRNMYGEIGWRVAAGEETHSVFYLVPCSRS